MAVITVKDRKAVLIPPSVIRDAKVRVGDRLDARADGGTIVLTPRTAVDAGIAEGLRDLKLGRTFGPYHSVAQAKKAFDARTRRQRRKSKNKT
jgi:hypothetical protein